MSEIRPQDVLPYKLNDILKILGQKPLCEACFEFVAMSDSPYCEHCREDMEGWLDAMSKEYEIDKIDVDNEARISYNKKSKHK
jgi:hypothetical protein